MQCSHCGSKKYVKSGKFPDIKSGKFPDIKSDELSGIKSSKKCLKSSKFSGIQRYKCKQCKRSFSDKARKFTYSDKERFLDMYLNNVGIRKSAKFMKCSPSMPVRWVREFADNLRKQLQNININTENQLPDIIEMDEIYTRIKKGEIMCRYGLLILDGEAKLLHISSAKPKSVQ